MRNRTSNAHEETEAERRRRIVGTLSIRDGLPYALIVERLATKYAIVTSKATVSRDVSMLRRAFRKFAADFDALEHVGEKVALYRAVYGRAMRSSLTATGADVARLLKVAVFAQNAEIALLQSVGLLPNQLGTLRLEKAHRAERIPTGDELQKLFDQTTVTEDEMKSEAENAWLYGDLAAASDAKP